MFKFILGLSAGVSVAWLTPEQEAHKAALPGIDFLAVRDRIKEVLKKSQDIWPFDDPRVNNYGPFMIRHAWHCAGSYRTSDGKGGCDGARQRFEPERSWADNTQLDKAKLLLYDIKQEFGVGLSWGDLIILTGSTAIELMGGPKVEFCGGRSDDSDGSDSWELGPTPAQQDYAPCAQQGDCKAPLGPTTIGLIYVNPEGPMGEPNPDGSFPQIRDTFNRMAMNDSETVALIGGGHAFGKAHGACLTGPGPSPKEDPTNPWPGTCGDGAGKGKGMNTWTSGFEGPWTTTPNTWSNQYFNNLINNEWENFTGPGGHQQWRPVGQPPSPSPALLMLTSDISLTHDPIYNASVHYYATNLDALTRDFGAAWYKLVTRDMGPITRCVAPKELLPPPQDFQYPLPPPPATFPDFNAVKAQIRRVMNENHSATFEADVSNGKPYYGAAFATLAYQCSSTFRSADYLGGCNGARIRFPPQAGWPANTNLTFVRQLLDPIYQTFHPANLSYADLFILAAQVAIEDATNTTLTFCPGRTDASDGHGSDYLKGYDYSTLTNLTVGQVVMHRAKAMGLTNREAVALQARLRSTVLQKKRGYSGSWNGNPGVLSNQYFKILLDPRNSWTCTGDRLTGECTSPQQKDVYMTTEDLALRWEPDLYAPADEFANNNTVFLQAFAQAWTKLVTLDRFDGPYGNVCQRSAPTPTPSPSTSSTPIGGIIGAAAGGLVVGCLLGFIFTRKNPRKESQMYQKVTGN